MNEPRPLSMPSFARRFRSTGAVTLWAVYVLILVGGIVRGTGAGMGCPDWPRCFGRWVPPTDVKELPANYLETYRNERIARNQRVAERLDRMGFHDVAQNIFRHPDSYIETAFNATKTWIEYVNRLVGALIGLLITLTFFRSLAYWKHDRVVTVVSLASLVTVGIQGWLGSLVVSTNLVPAVVTWHMALALLLLLLLHYAYWRTGAARSPAPGAGSEVRLTGGADAGLQWWAWALVALTTGQILLGTQVREEIDVVASRLNYLNRDLWVERLGEAFTYHRTFSTVLLLVAVYVVYRAWQAGGAMVRRLAGWTMALLLLNLLVGIGLATLAMPAWLQPVHLTVATGLFGVEIMLALEGMYRVSRDAFPPDEKPAGDDQTKKRATRNSQLETC